MRRSIALAVQRAMHDLRCQLADHVLHLSVPWHSERAVGDTLGRFSNDLNRLEVGITTLFGKTIREPMKAIWRVSADRSSSIGGFW